MNTQKFNRLIRKIKYSRQALTELYEHFYPRIVIHIKHCFGEKVDGRDIAHQFFLMLLEKEIEEYIRYPTSWVYTIAYNMAIEVLRKSGKREAAEEKTAAEDRLLDVQDEGTEILNCLKERERKIMYLRYWENFKLNEIAAILEINYSTLKSAHKKAKSILKKSFRKEKENEKN